MTDVGKFVDLDKVDNPQPIPDPDPIWMTGDAGKDLTITAHHCNPDRECTIEPSKRSTFYFHRATKIDLAEDSPNYIFCDIDQHCIRTADYMLRTYMHQRSPRDLEYLPPTFGWVPACAFHFSLAGSTIEPAPGFDSEAFKKVRYRS